MNRARPALPCPVFSVRLEDARFCIDELDEIDVKEEANPATPTAYAAMAINAEVYINLRLRSVGLEGPADGEANRKKMTTGSRRAIESGARTLCAMETSKGWPNADEPELGEVEEGGVEEDVGELAELTTEAHWSM